ncbi:MAG: integrase arm-type DNA-binding domain-containing protein [Thermoanaerobaculia bacterium]
MLTHQQIQKTKPTDKRQWLIDGRGLFLLIEAKRDDGKPAPMYWRIKYRFHGREGMLGLGRFPDVSLAQAREMLIDVKRAIAAGVNPAEQRKAERESWKVTFEAVATEWHSKQKSAWTERHGRDVIKRLKDNVFPYIGKMPIREISAPDVLRALRKIEARQANETARRVRQMCGQVFRYAIATGRADRDPSADLRGALAPVQTTHRAAVTDPDKVGGLLRALDTYDGSLIVKCALRFAPLVFVRPGELRHAEWSEVNWMREQWEIPAEKMKMRDPLIVPLSTQALAILREIRPLTGEGRYIFPNGRGGDRPMSDNAILAALRRSGIEKEEMTGHGFRAMARTILDEVLGFRVDIIEHQLAHAVRDPNGVAYNRAKFLPQRAEMMQKWADYLDERRKSKPQAEQNANGSATA